MSDIPSCTQCGSENTYPRDNRIVCPICGHEWIPGEADEGDEADAVIRDAVGNILNDGDTVTIIKDMKVKGSSKTLKVGTRVVNIRLTPGPGGHDVEAKVEGFGPPI